MKKTTFAISATLAATLLVMGPMACKKRGGEDPAASGGGGSAAATSGVDKGKALFTGSATCHTCHGVDGKGQTPTGRAIKARDLTNPATYKQGTDAASIAKTIKMGVKGTGMAPFPHIPEADRMELAKFVVSLQKK